MPKPKLQDEVEMDRGSRWVQGTVIALHDEHFTVVLRLPGHPMRQVRYDSDMWREVGSG